MGTAEIVTSILLNLIPVFAILLFYPVVRRDTWRRVYIRLSFCFMAFWVGYYILPVILFSSTGLPSTEFDLSTVYNPWLSAAGYYITVFLNVVAIFVRTTLFVLPFAFLFAPLFSVIILLLSLRSEKGSFGAKINELSYRYESSPLRRVRDRLTEKGWKEEKEMFKLMIVFLPISLYVLTLILTISGQGATTGGMVNADISAFIEDLVAYLAGFLAAVYLLYSSKLSFRGISVGDRIKFSVNRYLLTTGTILAAFSIIAFIVQFYQSWFTMAYFVIHYVMMTIIFAILLPLFEPFGSLLFIKTVNFIRESRLKNKLRNLFNRRTLSPLFSGFAIASTALLVHLIIESSISFFEASSTYGELFESTCAINASPTFSQELQYIRLFMIFSFQDVFELLVISLVLVWFVRQLNSRISGTILSVAFFSSLYRVLTNIGVMSSLIPPNVKYYWVTAVPAVMTAPAFELPASRLGTLLVSDTPLNVGAIPFLALSPLLLLLFLTYLVKYRKDPLYLVRKVEERTITEKVYSRLSLSPSLDELRDSPEGFVFRHCGAENLEKSLKSAAPEKRQDVKNLAEALAKNQPVTFSDLVKETKKDRKYLYDLLRYLILTRAIEVGGLELTSVTHKPALQSLYVTTKEGLSIFDYSFGSLTIEPALVSGMLTAITSFVKEATRSKQFLRTIEHGDVVLVVEYGNNIFATMVADQETPDLRIGLRQFVEQFEKRHASVLAKWTGAMPNVEKDKELAGKIFGQY